MPKQTVIQYPEVAHSKSAPVMLRRKQVEARSGLSRSTLYLRMSQRLWPRAVAISIRSVAWPDYEVDALNAARISGKTDAEIKVLVAKLEAARATA